MAEAKGTAGSVQQKLNFKQRSKDTKDSNQSTSDEAPLDAPIAEDKQVTSKASTTPETKTWSAVDENSIETPKKKPTIVRDNEQSDKTDEDSVHQRKLAFYEEMEDALEDDEEEDDPQVETEDEVNTVASGETSIRNKKKLKKVILPSFTRYQIMIQMDQENRDSPIDEEEDEDKSPAQRLRDILIAMVTQMKLFDPNSKIISWKTEPNFSYLNPDQFPSQIAQIAQYFNGFRANIKANKRIYLRVGIHTPDSQSHLYSFLKSWMELYGYTFNRCIIQAENASFIGWLAYSTAYTDPEIFRSRLVEHSNFEWGFKLVAVTTSDQEKPWLKRLKAVGVYVLSQMQNMAKLILCKQLKPYEDSLINIPDFTDKYLYVEPEKNYASKAGQLYYKKMVDRHRLHSESIRAEFSFGISVDLDKDFNLFDGTKVSLRDIILDLRVEDKTNALHGTRLFHSVDHWVDSSKVWIDNAKGPGASCHVFTYYKQVTSEASDMVTGLGKLVISRYDKNLAALMFNLDHFRGNSSYRWSESNGKFSTPLDRQMKENDRYDNNLQAVNILRELEKEEAKNEEKNKKEEQKKESMLIVLGHQDKEKSKAVNEVMKSTDDNEISLEEDSQDSLTTTGRMIRDKQLVDLVKKQEDNDLDSLDDTSVERKKPDQLELDDDESVASSLTAQSHDEESKEDEGSDFSISSGGSYSSGMSSVTGSVRSKEMFNLIKEIALSSDKPMNDDELRVAVRNYQLRKFNKKRQMFTATVENYIAKRNDKRNSRKSLITSDIDHEVKDALTSQLRQENTMEDDENNREVTPDKDSNENKSETLQEIHKGSANDGNEATSSGNTDGNLENDSKIVDGDTLEDNMDSNRGTEDPPVAQDSVTNESKSVDNTDNTTQEISQSAAPLEDDDSVQNPPPQLLAETSQQQQSETFDDDDPTSKDLQHTDDNQSSGRHRKMLSTGNSRRQSERLQIKQKHLRSKTIAQSSGANTGSVT